MVTGLVKKDTDSVIPTIIEVLSKGNFGKYVFTVAYLEAIGQRPFGFGIRMQSELNQARPRCPPEILNTPPRAHLVERGGTVTPSTHHCLLY